MPDGTFDIGPAPMHQPTDWEALARYITGESSAAESTAIEARLAAQPADRALLDALAAITRGLTVGGSADLDVEAALLAVKARRDDLKVLTLQSPKTQTGSRIRWSVLVPALAAAALLAVGLKSYFSSRELPNTQPVPASLAAPHTVATGVGVIDSLKLPDGSRVIIGPLSSVRVAQDFGIDRREIDVKGDVWVDVVHDPSKPFITHATGAAIQDIGTTFSVRTDAAEGVAVSVSQGSVSLRSSNPTVGNGVVLRSGEHGVLLSNGQVVTSPATADDLAWMSGQLVFREASLTDVATSLKRWYGIDLKVADPTLNSRHLTATFSTETPDRVLDVIRLALGAQIDRRGDTAIVRTSHGGERLK